MGDRAKEDGARSSRQGECEAQSQPTQAFPSGEQVRGRDLDRIDDDPSRHVAALKDDPTPKGRKRPRRIGNVEEQGACSSGHSPTPGLSLWGDRLRGQVE